MSRVISVHFEVFGKVQGVFFRKGTQEICQNNSVSGWVKNTSRGTVKGVAQGEESNVKTVKHWLSQVGSRRSRIDRCEFKNEKTTERTEYLEFTIRK